MWILGSICWYLSASVAGFVAICYLYKIYTSFPLVKNEYLNEVRCHFFHAPNLIFIMLLIGLPVHIKCSNQSEACVLSRDVSLVLSNSNNNILLILPALRIMWALAFCYQVLMTQYIYKAWMFSKRRNFTGENSCCCSGYWNPKKTSIASKRLSLIGTEAKPQFLLSTVGWFLLASL